MCIRDRYKEVEKKLNKLHSVLDQYYLDVSDDSDITQDDMAVSYTHLTEVHRQQVHLLTIEVWISVLQQVHPFGLQQAVLL